MLVTASVSFQKFAFVTKQIKLYSRMERHDASWQGRSGGGGCARARARVDGCKVNLKLFVLDAQKLFSILARLQVASLPSFRHLKERVKG